MENQIKDIKLLLEEESKARTDDFKSKLAEVGFVDSSQYYKLAVEDFEENEKSFNKAILDLLDMIESEIEMSNREEFEKLPRIAGILVETGVYYSHINERYTSYYEKGHESYLCGFVNGAWHAWQARVPEGYIVVPKDPTYEMVEAAIGNNGHIESIYRDMIEAAENK